MSEPKKELTLAEKIAKLPKWAQDYLHDAERTRDIAVRELQEYIDNQTPSHISIQEYVNGKFITRYIQSDKLEVDAHGVKLRVAIGSGDHGEKAIKLSWAEGGTTMGIQHVGFYPTSFQQAELIAKENMR